MDKPKRKHHESLYPIGSYQYELEALRLEIEAVKYVVYYDLIDRPLRDFIIGLTKIVQFAIKVLNKYG